MNNHSHETDDFPSEKDADFAEKVKQQKKVKPNKNHEQTTKDVVNKLNTEDLDEVLSNDLNHQIEELQQKVTELDDKYLRSQAEIQNMHTRHQKEQATQAKYAAQKLGTAVLPVVDNLERALAVESDSQADGQLHKGVEMVLQHLVEALHDSQIEAIGTVGEKFDPTIHQAVQTTPADDDHVADTVTQVLQKGYRLKDRTIRPAMVVVAK